MLRLISPFLLVCALFLIFVPNAHADCVADCKASTYCGGSSNECAQLLNTCYLRECSSKSVAPKTLSGAYGAIAYDEKNAAYGLSDSSKDKAAAIESALKYCGEHGDKCKVVDTFSNTCAAIAQDEGGSVGWAKNEVRRAAAENAVHTCNDKSPDYLCHVTLLHCYSE